MTPIDIKIIKNNVKGQLRSKLVAPLFLAGRPGIGKSATIQSIAKELNMELYDVSAPSLTLEVLNGLPDNYNAPELSKYCLDGNAVATKWSISEIIAEANRKVLQNPNGCILLIDDFHMIGEDLRPYFFKLFLQRSIGNYTLDPKVVILGTLNDSEEAGFSGINSAVRNRMAILKVDFDFDYWFESYGKNLHYLVSSFLKTKSHHILEDESVDIEGYASARAWTSIATELEEYNKEEIETIARKLASTQVSDIAANAFAKHVAYINAIDFSSVVKSRQLVDISKLEPLDAILYSYIVNFINTEEDGLYLFNLIEKNIEDENFIGFTIGELHNLYCLPNKKTKGVQYVIDKLLGNKPDLSSSLSKETKKKLEDYKIPNKQKLKNIASKYLL